MKQRGRVCCWARIARRGKATAVVALARKLAGIMFAVWRDVAEFDPRLLRPGGAPMSPLHNRHTEDQVIS